MPAASLGCSPNVRSCVVSDVEDVPPKSFLNKLTESLDLDSLYGTGTRLMDFLEQVVLLFCFVYFAIEHCWR